MPEDDLIEDDVIDEEPDVPEDAPADLDDDDDDELPADELDLEAGVGDVDVDVVDDVDLEGADDDAPPPVKAKKDDEEGDDDDDEEDDPDDVEADLDAILKDRIAAAEEEEDEEEVAPEPESSDGTGRILPKRPGEFVCQSCFLVKHPSQLADEKHQLCADCV